LDEAAVRQAKTLLRIARFGAFGVLDPAEGAPQVSRVAVATDSDGAPLILVSGLSAHTQALQADPRCSLLVGEPGKGDALAYPRLSLFCSAQLVTDPDDRQRVTGRFLRHLPKAALYADLPDFRYYRLEPHGASLNGGFGKAYRLGASDLMTANGFVLAPFEAQILDHMNDDHADAVALYAESLAGQPAGNWSLTGIDPEGVDLASGDLTARVWFDERVESRGDARKALVALVDKARATRSIAT
jgi:putative heme iron utilization protein